MIKYEFGASKSFQDIAKDFFNVLNPINTSGYKKDSLINSINTAVNTASGSRKEFFEEFKKSSFELLHEVITGEPGQLEEAIDKINKICSRLNLGPFWENNRAGLPKATEFGKSVYAVFNYDLFRQSAKCDWLLEQVKIPVCPYCNREATISVRDSRIKAKHLLDIDHYYCKMKNPFLSLSFYNLIPSCHTCNSRYKGTKSFSLSSHLHPYVDSFHKIFYFESNMIDTENLNFKLIFKKMKDVSDFDFERGKRIINDLGLEQVYQDISYKKEVIRISEVMHKYPYPQIDYLINLNIDGVNIFANQHLDYAKDYHLVLDEVEIRTDLIGKLKYDIAAPLKRIGVQK